MTPLQTSSRLPTLTVPARGALLAACLLLGGCATGFGDKPMGLSAAAHEDVKVASGSSPAPGGTPTLEAAADDKKASLDGQTLYQVLLGELAFQRGDAGIAGAAYGDFRELNPLAAFAEAEGLTLVVPRPLADKQGLGYASVFKGITLTVHSSLEAVGLTAAVATKLTEHNISANVIAGYYHDHVFVQSDRADDALAALREFAG